ncbi:MAG: hypothetical protein JWM33_357 [Caulobacteraceae bacterium]|nr:hypothetical protein [Caulobacteraceae bacterium]
MSLAPQVVVSEAEREDGLRRLVLESGFANAAGAVTTGVILTAFALHLGASNFIIGLLAALPFLGQILQAPSVLLVEHTRTRKRIAVLSSLIGRSMLLPMAALAFFPGLGALVALLGLQAIYCGTSAIGSCAWNGWIRDLAPEDRLGQVFARRTLLATLANLIAGLAAAFILDRVSSESGSRLAFCGLYVVGGVTSLISAAIVSGMPEPAMRARPAEIHLWALLTAPLRDPNFRRLVVFLTSWQFAINLATPFFTVFMVRQLGYSMTFVMLASIASQVSNALSLPFWGRLSDRFSNKSVLSVAAPIYILGIAAMTLAAQFGHGLGGEAYLIGLHVLMGLTVAAVTLGTTNVALKLSPKGSATAYLATNAMVSSLAAGLAPILGGLFADDFATRRLEVVLRWTNPQSTFVFSPVSLSHWDFYFLAAAVVGLYALHRLALIQESGEIHRREMVSQLLAETSRNVRNLSSVAGLRAITDLPANLLRDLHLQARLLQARQKRS